MSPERRALRQTLEALAFEGILHPAPGGWSLGRLQVRVPWRRQPGGRVRLLADPQDAQGRPLTLPALGRGLAQAGHDPATLLRAMRRSAHFLRAAGPVRADRLRLTGPALEAALIEGHPYHPGFKARIGFTDADNAAYGPETAAPFAPLWLQLDPVLIRRAGSDVAAGLSAPGAIPVHSWQWARLCDDPVIAGWRRAGRLRLLGGGPLMQATASLRTLARWRGAITSSCRLGWG